VARYRQQNRAEVLERDGLAHAGFCSRCGLAQASAVQCQYERIVSIIGPLTRGHPLIYQRPPDQRTAAQLARQVLPPSGRGFMLRRRNMRGMR
jgi:hypothetical protein